MSKPRPNRPDKALPHVLTALIAKRQELAGQIGDIQRRLKIAVVELDNVESTIMIFDPNIDLTVYGPRPVPSPHATFKGELSRFLMDALRTADVPLSTARLTEVVMKERGLPWDDLRVRRTMQRRVGASLNNWKRVKKIVKSSPGPGEMLNWEIDRDRIESQRGDELA